MRRYTRYTTVPLLRPGEYRTEQQEAALVDAEQERVDRRRVSDAEKQQFAEAYIEAAKRHRPPVASPQLAAQSFVAAFVRVERAAGRGTYVSEEALFIAVYYAKKSQLDRALWTHECEVLRDATRRMWAACPALLASAQRAA